MKIAITGARGMLGRDLTHTFSKDHDVVPLSRDDLDVTSGDEVTEVLGEAEPDVILHTAAFTGVDAAETQREQAFKVNALGARHVAGAAARRQALMVYFSTDYVFSGHSSVPYRESDRTDPLNCYGLSKLQGEQEVRSHCPAHLIIRTSWLFGSGGSNFVRTIARAGTQKEELKVVQDQRGKPTWTADLAQMSLSLVEDQRHGLYHVTNSGDCTWFEFACEIVAALNLPCRILPIRSQQFPRPAPRPAYSVLDNFALRRDGYRELRSWKTALRVFLENA